MGDQVRHNSSDAQGRHKLRPPPLLPECDCDFHKPGFRQDLETPGGKQGYRVALEEERDTLKPDPGERVSRGVIHSPWAHGL